MCGLSRVRGRVFRMQVCFEITLAIYESMFFFYMVELIYRFGCLCASTLKHELGV